MARPQRYTEATLARLAPGTLARIRAALTEGEAAADLVREAVDRELRRREKAFVFKEPGKSKIYAVWQQPRPMRVQMTETFRDNDKTGRRVWGYSVTSGNQTKALRVA